MHIFTWKKGASKITERSPRPLFKTKIIPFEKRESSHPQDHPRYDCLIISSINYRRKKITEINLWRLRFVRTSVFRGAYHVNERGVDRAAAALSVDGDRCLRHVQCRDGRSRVKACCCAPPCKRVTLASCLAPQPHVFLPPSPRVHS